MTMEDPLSFTANVFSVATPAAKAVHRLYESLSRVNDAPNEVLTLRDNLLSVEQSLSSLQDVRDQRWELLGPSVTERTRTAISRVGTQCSKFHVALGQWSSNSTDTDGDALMLGDRMRIGLFKHEEMANMSRQLCVFQETLTFVSSLATLQSTRQQAQMTAALRDKVSADLAKIEAAASSVGGQLDDVSRRIREGRDQTRDVHNAQQALLETLQSLLANVRKELDEAGQMGSSGRISYGHVTNTFGADNNGLQIGEMSGNQSGFVFGGRKSD